MNEQDALRKERFAEKSIEDKSSNDEQSAKVDGISKSEIDDKVNIADKSQAEVN